MIITLNIKAPNTSRDFQSDSSNDKNERALKVLFITYEYLSFQSTDNADRMQGADKNASGCNMLHVIITCSCLQPSESAFPVII